MWSKSTDTDMFKRTRTHSHVLYSTYIHTLICTHLLVSEPVGNCHMPGSFRNLGRWCSTIRLTLNLSINLLHVIARTWTCTHCAAHCAAQTTHLSTLYSTPVFTRFLHFHLHKIESRLVLPGRACRLLLPSCLCFIFALLSLIFYQ